MLMTYSNSIGPDHQPLASGCRHLFIVALVHLLDRHSPRPIRGGQAAAATPTPAAATTATPAAAAGATGQG